MTLKALITQKDNYMYHDDIIELILSQVGRGLDLRTGEMIEALGHYDTGGEQALRRILQESPEGTRVSQDLFVAAAGCWRSEEIMRLLLQHAGKDLEISKDVMLAAAANRKGGSAMMKVFFEERDAEVKLTEEIVASLVNNPSYWLTLLHHRPSEFRPIERVLLAAVTVDES